MKGDKFDEIVQGQIVVGFICGVEKVRIFFLENEELFEVYLVEGLNWNCGGWIEER